MHSVLFSIKRAFHKSTWHGRGLLDPLRLTPSRFDILYILRKNPLGVVWQSAIRKILGIAGPTLYKMVRALELLGFLTRNRSELDRRQVEVSLTARGRRAVQCAIDIFLEGGVIQDDVEYFMCPTPLDPEAAFHSVSQIDGQLLFARRRLRDRATLHYPWHPED